MGEIFISHASADLRLAKLLVDFLKEAIGVPASAIFCSSVKGHDIPLGEDFDDYIKEKIKAPKLVILLMTPAYIESLFCLMELGAAWAQGVKSLAIVVPPIEFQTVTKTLGLKQAWIITDKSRLIDLRDLVRNAIPNLEKRSEHTWDEKRTQWGVDLRRTLLNLQQATKIDAEKHDKVSAELRDKEQEVESLETMLAQAQERNALLESLKDKEAVRAVKRRDSESETLLKEFNDLIEAVGDAKPKTSRVVLKHIIADHFDRAGQIDWYHERQEFEDAIKYGLISPDDYQVQWERDKLKPLRKAIRDVQFFLEGDDGIKVRRLQDAGVPMDPDDLEFWEHHLSI